MKISLFFILLTAALINDVSPHEFHSRAIKGQFVFAASIYSKGLHKCNGAIISHFHIVTAGHCIYKEKIIDLRVIVGTMRVTSSTKWREVQNTHVFGGYDPNEYDNDIGIIQLKQPLSYSLNLQNIPYKETGEICAIGLDCKLIRFRSSETDSILRISQSLWWHLVMMSIENGRIEVYNKPMNYPGHAYVLYESERLEDSGAPIICNGRLTAILSTYMKDTADMVTTAVMIAPYENWIEDKIYQLELENM